MNSSIVLSTCHRAGIGLNSRLFHRGYLLPRQCSLKSASNLKGRFITQQTRYKYISSCTNIFDKSNTLDSKSSSLHTTWCTQKALLFFSSPLNLADKNTQDDASKAEPQKDLQTENIMTVPNLLTLSRAILSPVLGYLVVTGSVEWALGIFVYASVTDWLDGWIARRWPSQRTVCGTIIDPIADKLLVVIMTGSLCMASLLPGPLAFLIVAKDVGLVIGGLVLRYQSLNKPVTLNKFFDMKMPSVEMKPLLISKLNTALQMSTLALSMAAPVFGFVAHPLLQGMWCATGISTVATAVSYVFAKDAYEIKKK